MQVTQTWWITGAGAGIGRALAQRLAVDGHTVYATSRSRADLDSLAVACGPRVIPLAADVADPATMAAFWRDAQPRPGRLDGVILAAGICEYVEATAFDVTSFRRVMDVNFHGAVHSCHAALPLLLAPRQDGAPRPQLIGVGSLSSALGLPRAEAYGASKAALQYFLDSLRTDIGDRVDITSVQPGFVATRLTAVNDFPMPWLWSVDEAADYIYARLGKGRRNIVFPWQLALWLRVAAALPSLWYGLVAPRLRRTAASRYGVDRRP